jgi:DNA primase
MAYSREDIDRVRERSDLAELASEVTKVKRSGRSVMAVCPFHSEKTPSLSIDPARGLYHCFGCGKSGDVFRWVQETQTLDFNDSVEFLARRAGITLTADPGAAKRRDRRERLVDAVKLATAFYHDRLKSGADGGQARGYLRQRGYEADVVEQFVIGFSPPDWDLLVRHLRDADVSDEAMMGAGLASRSRKGGLIDRFRGRLMFPIYDVRGDAVGFGARILDGDGPKYLNSPETPIYHKSRLLYGLNWSKSQIVRTDEAVVVEGYTDVIAFHLADMPFAVATCGTALGEEHLDLLRRFSQRVVLAFDADEAGAGAAIRGFDRSVPGDLDLRVALLPEGRDPADLVSAGDTGKLAAAIADSLPLLQFRIENELDRFDLAEPEARGRAVQAAAQLISLHPDPVVRHEYAVLVSRRTGVEVAQIEGAKRSGRSGKISAPQPIAERPTTGGGRAEWELLRLLLANDPGARRHDVGADLFREPRLREAYELFGPAVAALPPGEDPDLGAILGDDDSAVATLVRRLALQEEPPLSDADEVMIKLRLVAVEQRIADLGVEQRSLGTGVENQDRSDGLTYLISSLEQERRNLRSRE